MSVMLSAPNFSRKASARTMATIDSPITAAAGTAQESARSLKARAGSPVERSTVRRALAIVEIGFIDAATTTGSPLVIPPSRPPRRLLARAGGSSPGRISSCTSLERRALLRVGDPSYAVDRALYADAEIGEELLGYTPRGDPGRRLAGAGALEH